MHYVIHLIHNLLGMIKKMKIMEQSKDKIKPVEETKDIFKRSELEQTQELLVGLTSELFNKIEKLEKKEKSKDEEIDLKKEKSANEEMDSPKEESKIEFTDLSWYREKLDSSQLK